MKTRSTDVYELLQAKQLVEPVRETMWCLASSHCCLTRCCLLAVAIAALDLAALVRVWMETTSSAERLQVQLVVYRIVGPCWMSNDTRPVQRCSHSSPPSRTLVDGQASPQQRAAGGSVLESESRVHRG